MTAAMSFRDENGHEILQMNSLWAASFKLLLLLVPFVALTLFSWGTWVTVSIFEHNSRIKLLEDRSTRGGGGSINGASINVGRAGGADDIAGGTARDYLTVKEVALREARDERTITLWIEQGRLIPAPVKDGKSWVIDPSYRVIPQYSATGGNDPQNAATP
jgi:hypothetical protein